jgi:hypothetical protein
MFPATHLRKTGQINKSKTEHMRRVDLEVNRLPVDSLVVSSNPSRLILDFPLDILELCKPSIWQMMKLCPCSMWFLLIVAWDIDELQNKRSSRYDAAATGQEVSTDDVF